MRASVTPAVSQAFRQTAQQDQNYAASGSHPRRPETPKVRGVGPIARVRVTSRKATDCRRLAPRPVAERNRPLDGRGPDPLDPFGYGLTGSASTNAASWRSSGFRAPLRQPWAKDSDMGSGQMSSSSFSTPS